MKALGVGLLSVLLAICMPEVIQYCTVASRYLLLVSPRPLRKVEEIVLHGPDPTEGSGPCMSETRTHEFQNSCQ